MREIKFRAWDNMPNNERMLYRTLFDRNWYATPKNDEKGAHCVQGVDPRDRVEFKIMQYIGLKDNKRTKKYPNGQEIYEGDIVNSCYQLGDLEKYEKRIVVFYEYSYMLKPINGNIKNRITEYFHHEIIGNIHENPELL